MHVHDVSLLACPESGHPLVFHGTNLETVIMDGVLVCIETGTAWGVEEGWARLARDVRTTPGRARLDRLQEAVPRLHDPMVRMLPQILGGGGAAARRAVFERLGLDALPATGARVLEVGVATGQNLSPLLDAVPADTAVELWGTDSRLGLLVQAKDRCGDDPRLADTRLLIAAPDALPFRDAAFDRVLHMGGLHGQVDPARAVAEMARVTRPGGIVVVVDERPDASDGFTGWRRRLLSAMGGAETSARPLGELAPAGARGARVEAIDPVLEALSFTA
jgi:SAM-dependent methyltransferase